MRKKIWTLLGAAIRGEQFDLTTIGIPRAIVLLAVPMMLEMAMESVFALVDTFFVGRVGTEALTTVGLTEVMMTLIYSLAIGLSTAPMAMVARFVGEKQPEKAGRAAGQAILLGILVSLLLAVPGVLYAEDLLALMGASPEVIRQGAGYTRIMFASNVVIMLLFVINGIFRGAGEATKAMRVLWIANGINIVLDPIFIFGLGPIPGLGVEGAAIATTIGRGCGVVYQLYLLFGDRSVVKMGERAWRVDWNMQKRIGRIASTGAFQYLIASASWVFLMRVIASFGDAAVAGYTVSIRLILFTLLPAWGLANAAATFVGQNLGAGQPARAERGVWVTLKATSLYLGILSVGYFIFARPLVQAFVGEAEAVGYGIQSLRLFAVGYVLFGLGMIPIQAFNGAGDTRTPTLINFICFWILEIPLGYFLALNLGLEVQGVVSAVVIAEGILAVLALWLFWRGSWKTTVV
ncbi:MATE family efflux transporter [Neolewinella lacunae]|uniref:Multidrug-efflux transporter n=1 Tax=Neolewinella lacunae TaxID=1517758 RepID=A0A923PJW1_9BACT|nr:MATE family efflux transporter [Neolewinella lacunae]MBC6993061.1 MATE family efflux transporter [Neolewinella lacunae]MDN3635883.1 MATE family efflux transporter [Neolewinella lacunae]